MGKFLVTGGAGFIGSHLATTLSGQGHSVRVIDNLDTGSRQNLPAEGIEFLEGSITDPGLIRKAMTGVEVVFHQAARGSVPRSIEDPFGTHDANVTGTLQVLIAARDAGVRRVVCASSSSVYGDTPTLPKIETMPLQPKSPYAMSKLTLEHYCKLFWDVYQLETIALRYFNVFGPGQNPALQYAAVVPIFISRMLRNESCLIYGDGEQTRDFTYIADCISANIQASTADRKACGQAFNIACEKQISVNMLFRMLSELLHYDKPPQYEPERAGDVKHSLAAIEKARLLIGFQPAVDFQEGLRRTVAWYKQQAGEV